MKAIKSIPTDTRLELQARSRGVPIERQCRHQSWMSKRSQAYFHEEEN